MPKGSKRRVTATIGLLAVGAAAAVGWWHFNSNPQSPHGESLPTVAESAPPASAEPATPAAAPNDAAPAAEAKRLARDASRAQIAAEAAAAESATPQTAAAISAPPNWSPEPGDAQAQTPTPPDGYAFTDFHGEMARAAMTEYDRAAAPNALRQHPWLAAPNASADLIGQARSAGRDWAFGWIGIDAQADAAALEDAFAALGVDVIGRSGALLRARLPADAEHLEQLRALSGVAGIAATPATAKVGSELLRELAAASPQAAAPAFITLMEEDADGRWRRALESFGAVVGHYEPDLRVYPANIPYNAVRRIADADFVLSVEAVGTVQPSNDAAMPAMGADALRMLRQETQRFTGTVTGGARVPIGVMDTGLNTSHLDIASGRRSICGGNFVSGFFDSPAEEDQDLWVDAGFHGTHVTGIFAGNGRADPRHVGAAPLVQHIRFAKVLSTQGGGSALSVWRGMDFLGTPSTCGHPDTASVKPLIVNMSLSANSIEWDGRSASERKLDVAVWDNRQLYVVAQSNSGFSGFANYAGAKNSLAVGAANNFGDIANFSSHGPTTDGRLAPQVVGTGVQLRSPQGGNSRSGYVVFSGTSMASPAVAGVAAMLLDAVPGLREQPAAARARLMASAIKPDAFLGFDGEDTGFPVDNTDGPGTINHRYGLGKVSARTSVLNRDDENGWTSGSAVVELGDDEYAYRDITVPEGASRLDIVMAWDERPAEAIATTLLNDLDLWLDQDGDCPASQPAACGEASSRSTRDNVEWLIVRNPPAGRHRIKVVPKHGRVDDARAALAWTVIRGPSTPQLAVDITSGDSLQAAPGEAFDVEATITADGYVAAGTMLRIDCRADSGTACNAVQLIAAGASSAGREDAVERTLGGESGDAISLGEIAGGETQTVTLKFRPHAAEQRFRIYLTASSWNADPASASVDIAIGGAAANTPAPAVADMPANDHFANAIELADIGAESGETQFDLLLATPEPGDPVFATSRLSATGGFASTVRPRSLWYRWTPPESGLYRFSIGKRSDIDIADEVQIGIFSVSGDGTSPASLQRIDAKTGGGLSFAATGGETYALRLGITSAGLYVYGPPPPQFVSSGEDTPIQVRQRVLRRDMAPLTLSWGPAEAPAHDDYANAARISGMSGSVASSNHAATREEGENLTPLAATVWHRWQAPEGADGDWRFAVDRRYLNVAVFSGADIHSARLVSGIARSSVHAPVRAGHEYFIAVAADSALSSGSNYQLRWGPSERSNAGNDHLANAAEVRGLPASFAIAAAFEDFFTTTVQPDEPPESGVRTRWWTWRAPLDATYTWRADTFGDNLRVAVFAVDESIRPGQQLLPDQLTHAASSAVKARDIEFSFAAEAGKLYAISIGVLATQPLSQLNFGFVVLEWGPTPANDDIANATVLDSDSGMVGASLAFATTQPGEPTGIAGGSSLWWFWQPGETGWYRFAANDPTGSANIVIYRVRGDGAFYELEQVALGRQLHDATAVFRAEPGVRYAIRIGQPADGLAEDIALTWQRNDRPAWLRHLGRIAHDDVAPDGNLIELVRPGHLAFNADGSELYVGTARGLVVFARDPQSGALGYLQTLPGADARSRLVWHEPTASLLAGNCLMWHRFASRDGGGLADGESLGGAAPCTDVPSQGANPNAGTLFTDADGELIHVARFGAGIDTYRFDPDTATIDTVDMLPLPGITAAAIGTNDRFVYAAAGTALWVLERDADTGMLTVVHEPPADTGDDSNDNGGDEGGDPTLRLLVPDRTGKVLFAFAASRATTAFNIVNPEAPRQQATLEAIGGSSLGPVPPGAPELPCLFGSARQQTRSVDVFCNNDAFTVRLVSGKTLRAEEHLRSGGFDRFGHDVPFLNLGSGIATPADGRHIYAVQGKSLHVFKRGGSL